MCKECMKFAGTLLTGTYIGEKMAYGPTRRSILVNEVVCSLAPGAVKDDSEIYVTAFHHLSETDPDFVREKHVITKPVKILGHKVMDSSDWVNRPSINDLLKQRG